MHSLPYARRIHTHTDLHKRQPHLIMARGGSLPTECFFSIFILHLLRDGQGGRLTPLPCFRDDGSRENKKCSPPLQNSCITLPQQYPILHNRKKPFDRFCMGLCSHAWCFRQGSMKSDPQVNDIPIPLKVPSGLPCLNMQNRLLPAKWPVTQISACACIFIPLSLEVCNICLFKLLVPSGWEVAVLKQDQALQGQRICFIMSRMRILVFYWNRFESNPLISVCVAY